MKKHVHIIWGKVKEFNGAAGFLRGFLFLAVLYALFKEPLLAVALILLWGWLEALTIEINDIQDSINKLWESQPKKTFAPLRREDNADK